MKSQTISLQTRLELLSQVAGRIAQPQVRERLANLIHQAVGKPQAWCQAEVDFCVNSFAALAAEFQAAFQIQTFEDAERRSEVHHLPCGTVLVFSPFNSPLECLQLALLPALAAGNRVVVKAAPSAEVPVQAFLELFSPEFGQQLEFHKGGAEVGKTLVQRDDVALIVFTGSQSVGREIAVEAARLLKPVILELGGKDALIVMPDADLDQAVDMAIEGAFGFAGQVCTASEQVWVSSQIAEDFERRLMAKVQNKISAGWTETLISSAACDRVEALIDEAVDKGAQRLSGQKRSSKSDRTLVPTVLKNVSSAARLTRDEVFGPVLVIADFEDEGEIIQAFEKSEFALGLTILTQDLERARDLALRLPNAMIGINSGCIGAQGTPWLGNRKSGLGMLGSIEGHRQFTSKRVLTFPK